MRQHPPRYSDLPPGCSPRRGVCFFLSPPGGLGVPPRLAGKAGHVPFLSHQRLPRRAQATACRSLLLLALFVFWAALDAAPCLWGGGRGRRSRARSVSGAQEGGLYERGAGSAAAQPKERSETASPSRGRPKRSGRAAVGRSPRRQSRRR